MRRMDRKVLLEKIGHIVSNFPEVEAAYVFGSFLERDDFRDIDVALLVSEKLSSYRALKLAMHIGSELDFKVMIGRDFDVRVLNNAHPEFQYEVVKTGVAVFSRNMQTRFDYEADVLSAYLVLKDMYDFFDREYLARA